MSKKSSWLEIPLNQDKGRFYRFFEILPAVLTISLILSPLILSLINVTAASFLIIGYMVFWLLKAVSSLVRINQGYSKMQRYMKVDWNNMLSDLNNPSSAIERLGKKKKLTKLDAEHLENLVRYQSYDNSLAPEDAVHAIIFPMFNETLETLVPSVESILESNYDCKKMIFLIAYEERGGIEAGKAAKYLEKTYKDKFMWCKAIEHPDGMENEVVGKGGNIVYAAEEMMTYLEAEKIEARRVVVTTLDADNRPHEWYFSNLSYLFCVTKEPKYASYQPIPLYTNNIWDAPAPMRVIAVGNSFFQVVQSVRVHLLRNFSSHAQSLEGLIETDFWSVRTIVEDGHQYWRSWIAMDGRNIVVPQFIPICQDAVLSENYKKTFKAQFLQLRRWAYGASDIAYMASAWRIRRKHLPFFPTLTRWLRLLDTHVSWSSAPLVLASSGWMPYLVSRFTQDYPTSIAALRLPTYAAFLQTGALIGVPVFMYLTFRIMPERPSRYGKRRNVWLVLQWAWLPFASIFYGSMSSLYSQIRLMLGKYLEKFDVTEKHVK